MVVDFTLVLWPYYVAVTAIYGTVTYLTDSILPAVVLHTVGNLYSNFDLWLHGQAEWQASAATTSVWQTGVDASFVRSLVALLIVATATLAAYAKLGRTTPRRPAPPRLSRDG